MKPLGIENYLAGRWHWNRRLGRWDHGDDPLDWLPEIVALLVGLPVVIAAVWFAA